MLDYLKHYHDSGVYELFCEATGKKYVGRSADVGMRIMSHIYILRKGNHYNKELQSDFDKIGEEFFDYRLIFKSENIDELMNKEHEFLNNISKKSLYNKRFSSRLGEVPGGMSQSQRNNISERQIGSKNHFFGKKHSEEAKAKIRASKLKK